MKNLEERKNKFIEKANEKGVKLIQIFEDEYLDKKEIVLSKIRRLIGFDLSLTESQMAEKLNYHKIYDCGLLKYVYDKNIL